MRVLVAWGTVVVIAICGCGSSGPTKADFIRKADRICADYHRQFVVLNRQLDAAADDAASQKVEGKFYDVAAREADRLSRLPRPSSDEAVLQRWVDSVDALVAAQGDLVDAYDPSISQDEFDRTNARFNAAAAKNDGIAKGYGMKVCGPGRS